MRLRKNLLPMFLALVLSMVIVPVEMISSVPKVTVASSTTVHDVAVISVVPIQAAVNVWIRVDINVVVENRGNFTEDVDVYVFADANATTVGDEITIGSRRILGLGPTENKTETFSWVPKVEGNYTISGKATIPVDDHPEDNMLVDGVLTVLRPLVYLDPPSITGVTIGEIFTVDINILDAVSVTSWQLGLTFNPSVLECTGFFEGEFLKSAGSTQWVPGSIDNWAGKISGYGCVLLGDARASGAGRLAYTTFRVKALGVSDMHFFDLVVGVRPYQTYPDIIDVYTVVVNATAHKVVTVSNSTSVFGTLGSGFYGHAFNETLNEISFKVKGPMPGYSNVTIPRTLLWPDPPYVWTPIIDGRRLSIRERTVTSNATHSFIYFTYSACSSSQPFHDVHITTRFMPSNISIALSSPSATLGSNITVSGDIDPVRPAVNVTILYRPSGGTWTPIANATTDQNSSYTYSWTPEKAGTYEFMARWEGDEETLGDESDPPHPTLTALLIPASIYVFEVDGVYVFIESNSTVSDFACNRTLNEISFNVTGPYGNIYFSNVTIPRTLMWADNLSEWTVTIDGIRLSTEERTITSNATHTSIYFTYTPGVHTVQITTRFTVSTISITLSPTSIVVGSNVTISGGIDPVRANVTVTVLYRRSGETEWAVLANVTTNQNGNYSYSWRSETIEPYEFMARWEGDEYTLGDESDPPHPTLIVLPLPLSKNVEEVLWEGQVFYVVIESNSTISDFNFSQPDKQMSFNATGPYGGIYFSNVSVPKELLAGTLIVYIDGKIVFPVKTDNETHTFLYFTYSQGINEVKIKGTYVIRESSAILMTLSPASITLGSNVTISGGIDPVRANVTVTVLYRRSGETEWAVLANVTTNQNGHYSHTWTPGTAGTYEVKASWEGDDLTKGDESDVQTLTVEEAPTPPPEGIDPYLIAAAAVVIIIIAAIVVYFVRGRKPG